MNKKKYGGNVSFITSQSSPFLNTLTMEFPFLLYLPLLTLAAQFFVENSSAFVTTENKKNSFKLSPQHFFFYFILLFSTHNCWRAKFKFSLFPFSSKESTRIISNNVACHFGTSSFSTLEHNHRIETKIIALRKSVVAADESKRRRWENLLMNK
jgi:hypothetical protein